MRFFFLSAHNKPSGGTKVLNQMVNLCLEKGYKSYLVIVEDKVYQAEFIKEPCSVINLTDFKRKCQKDDIVINCWQHKLSHQAVCESKSKAKIFWQHGASIPVYKDFNGEEVFKSKIYSQHWNVSEICADYIKKKYNIKKINIVHPFFDDNTLLKYLNKSKKIDNRTGILCLRRRGQEALTDIINLISDQKITILNKSFTDEQLYNELIKHKFFISYDNGVRGKILIKSKLKRFIFNISRYKNKLIKKHGFYSQEWIVPKGNLLGFPVTACEAAWLGANVIGFAMGGGLEWMSNDNMYLAKDGDVNSLLEKIKEAIEDDENNQEIKRKNAFKAVSIFNKENTWKQITDLLNI